MKLSILSPVYKLTNELETFLQSVVLQTKDDFEVVVSIDIPSEKDYEIIEKYQEILNGRLKVVFNSKRQGNLKNITSLASVASGEYLIVVYPETNLKDYFVKTFIDIQKKHDADVIEFRPRFKGIFDWTPISRFSTKNTINLKEDKKPLAYTFPVIFNKFFKREKFFESTSERNFRDSDSKFLVDLTFKVMLDLESYLYVDEVIVNEWNNNLNFFNPNKILRDWQNLEAYVREFRPHYLREISYSKMYHLELFIPSIIGMTTKKRSLLNKITSRPEKFSPLVNNYYEKLKSLRKLEFEIMIKSNFYFLTSNDEVKMLLQFSSPTKWKNLHKEV